MSLKRFLLLLFITSSHSTITPAPTMSAIHGLCVKPAIRYAINDMTAARIAYGSCVVT